MKKLTAAMMVIVMTVVMGCIAHGEEMPAEQKAFITEKTFQTEGQLRGTWTIGLKKDESGLYPCVLDLGDGRKVIVPLTDDEVNDLMCKALKEHDAKVKAEEKASNPSVPARVLDWITFWD
jgi:hypothetical protein